MTSPSGCYVSQRKRIDGFWLVLKNVHQSERANKNFFLKTPTGCEIDGFKKSTRYDWCTRTCTNQNVQIRFFLKHPLGAEPAVSSSLRVRIGAQELAPITRSFLVESTHWVPASRYLNCWQPVVHGSSGLLVCVIVGARQHSIRGLRASFYSLLACIVRDF